MKKKVILIRYGEIYLKGRNRPFFERTLVNRIKQVLDEVGDFKLTKGQGRIIVEGEKELDDAINRLTEVFGIISISPAFEIDKDFEVIKKEALNLCNQRLNNDIKTFKVETKRADKKFPLKSPEISRELGAYILQNIDHIKVDVKNPDLTLFVEIRDRVYIYTDIIKGIGGMPVGANGKAMLLLSGGIDSPVAGWMIAKRGVSLEAVYYHSFPFTGDKAKQKVIELAHILSKYTGPIKLHIVHFTDIQKELYEKCPDNQITILMRRFMMRIAEQLAIKNNALALITGESLGQVASQTIESLNTTNSVVKLPVLRPLIGFDKIEIMDRAEQIGTYETSILPYQDCCTVFVPKNPVTKPRLDKIEKSEQVLDVDKMVTDAVKNVETIDIT
ncbi:MAG: tRNA 4-thiouridine(8) synthase ThiI [Clostridia bacterium]|nr:tRNA 4-thiouridine(8) synthase ThiI [Clostridia bacterium]